MMADFVGNDLSRLSSELDKLSISLPEGGLRITPEIVERNVGISKDFNNYELLNAIITRNILKATQIIQYFEQNPKNNPLVVTISVLFNFFQILCYAIFDRQVGEWNYERTESKVFFPIQRLFDSHASLQRI